MSVPAIHQFVAGYAAGDAISNEVRMLRSIFKGWGAPESFIFAERRNTAPDMQFDVKDIREDVGLIGKEDIALLHLSIGCDANLVFKDLPCKKAILYHNITPDRFFRGFNEKTAHMLARGRQEAELLAHSAQVVLACSKFNAEELASMGYPPATVLPLVLDFSALRGKASKRVLNMVGDGLTNILFVGRCVPNKCIEDLLNAYYYYVRFVNPLARLIHVGTYGSADPYHLMLLARAKEMGFQNLLFAGPVSQEELNAYYRSAHVFLCMSEHEGFCIPLIEAMVNDVPVAAYVAGAVPETMDGAGVLFHQKDYAIVAETIDRLAKSTPLREGVLKAQRARLARYEAAPLANILREALAPLM